MTPPTEAPECEACRDWLNWAEGEDGCYGEKSEKRLRDAHHALLAALRSRAERAEALLGRKLESGRRLHFCACSEPQDHIQGAYDATLESTRVLAEVPK